MDVNTRSSTRFECISLAEALFCAECEMISNSKTYCRCCGSAAVIPVARVFGGSVPQHRRAALISAPVHRSYALPAKGEAVAPPRRGNGKVAA